MSYEIIDIVAMVTAKLKELQIEDDDAALELAEWLEAKIIEHGTACFAAGLREGKEQRQGETPCE